MLVGYVPTRSCNHCCQEGKPAQLLWKIAAAKLLQSCPTLCDPIDGSPPGSPVPGTLQARALEWVAVSSSNAWKRKVKGKLLSRVRLLATPWTAAYQAPPSMGFSRQEYWSGVPSPSPLWKISNQLLKLNRKFPGGLVVKTGPSIHRLPAGSLVKELRSHVAHGQNPKHKMEAIRRQIQ